MTTSTDAITDDPPPSFRIRALTQTGNTLREVSAHSANGAIIAVQTFRDEFADARIIVNVNADLDARELEALRVAGQRLGCMLVIGG